MLFHLFWKEEEECEGRFYNILANLGIEDCSKSFIFLEHGKYKWGERKELFRKTIYIRPNGAIDLPIVPIGRDGEVEN
jgi:hypothetical protein